METLTRTHLVLEYAGGGELYAFVHERGKLSEAEAKPLFAQVVAAVSHMVISGFLCLKARVPATFVSKRLVSSAVCGQMGVLNGVRNC